MLHRSMCKSLKFPREPCCTEMRSLGWLSIKMSLMQPWKALTGGKHWEAVRLSGHPVRQREKWRGILKWSVIALATYQWKTLRSNYCGAFSFIAVHTSFVVNPSIFREGAELVQNKAYTITVENKNKYIERNTNAITCISFLLHFSSW